MSPACSFEVYSLHFHLPLKTAAEKFGVRATAFKKRCRSIGIRHWPYRKVRSLRRSLQELDRCQEQGVLNDKQQYQFATFKKQLDRLMSPETYGIDPSGRIQQDHFDDSDDESDDNESCGSSAQSPRYGVTFGDCNISPADGDRTFGDFSTPPHLRLLRTKHPYLHSTGFPRSMTQHFGHELHLHPLQRLQAPPPKDTAAGPYPKFSFGMFDPYAHEASPVSAGRAKVAVGGAMRSHASSSGSVGKEDASDQQPSSGLEAQPPHDFMPGDVKYEDVRSLNEADDEFADSTGQMDYTNDRFFDDVFLQISPDYGCLV
ncbi:hypothetical protein PybrP1_005972 [[Pythium] brassicae (nom. inval.)]|nr:hypothetical protein PybrP1_005972 [[Pythium] brassicae (nom. inval.)]